METGNQFLGTERIGKLMRQYAIPCIISLLVGALYNIVDQIFIANASYLGSYGNAANTVVFPLTVVALAIAVMVGDGCCAFVSMALGRKELDKANERLAEVTAKLHQELIDINQNKDEQIFTAQEVYDIVNESYFNLNKTYKTNLNAIQKLSTRITENKAFRFG